jgi:hypothetical protein
MRSACAMVMCVGRHLIGRRLVFHRHIDDRSADGGNGSGNQCGRRGDAVRETAADLFHGTDRALLEGRKISGERDDRAPCYRCHVYALPGSISCADLRTRATREVAVHSLTRPLVPGISCATPRGRALTSTLGAPQYSLGQAVTPEGEPTKRLIRSAGRIGSG